MTSNNGTWPSVRLIKRPEWEEKRKNLPEDKLDIPETRLVDKYSIYTHRELSQLEMEEPPSREEQKKYETRAEVTAIQNSNEMANSPRDNDDDEGQATHGLRMDWNLTEAAVGAEERKDAETPKSQLGQNNI